MNRTGLLIALGVAVLVGVLFGVYPRLDLDLSALFYNAQTERWAVVGPRQQVVRLAAAWFITLLVAPAFLSLAVKLVVPRRRLWVPGRAVVLLISTLALGPGLLANVTLKDHWGRPRPIDVTEFKGDEHFVAWWDPRGDCAGNCSFIAGEPSGAFWTLAPAALAPPAWRALAYAGALAFGGAVGLLRIAGGGHFFTDVVFAGVFTFLLIWTVHGFLYRWRATRVSDEAVEGGIERVAMPPYLALTRVVARMCGRQV